MRRQLTNLLLIAGILSVTTCSRDGFAQNQRRAPNPAFAKVEDDPALPRVLLIGDSISIGYTVDVRNLMKGKANVHRIPTNGGPTTRGLQSIDEWLGDSKWDVIHFNWGLHDLKYINDKGELSSVEEGKQQVPIDEYEANLKKLVKRLQQTNAKLIWRNTTPIPKGSDGRVPGDEIKYNAVAAQIMDAAGIPIDDHYSLVKPRMDELMRPANVHFFPNGSKVLAEKAVKEIQAALSDKS